MSSPSDDGVGDAGGGPLRGLLGQPGLRPPATGWSWRTPRSPHPARRPTARCSSARTAGSAHPARPARRRRRPRPACAAVTAAAAASAACWAVAWAASASALAASGGVLGGLRAGHGLQRLGRDLVERGRPVQVVVGGVRDEQRRELAELGALAGWRWRPRRVPAGRSRPGAWAAADLGVGGGHVRDQGVGGRPAPRRGGSVRR